MLFLHLDKIWGSFFLFKFDSKNNGVEAMVTKIWEWTFFVMNTVINYDYNYVLCCRYFLVEEFIISHAQNKIERTIWKSVTNESNLKLKNQTMSSIRVEFEQLKINVWKCTPSKVVNDVFHYHKKVFTKTTN